MLIVLKKTYTLSVTIQEGNDEFWEGLRDRSGADDVLAEIKRVLAEAGWQGPQCHVRFEKFEERGPLG